jgi:hypothetical protein
MTESQQTGDRLLTRQISSAIGSTIAPGTNGGAE